MKKEIPAKTGTSFFVLLPIMKWLAHTTMPKIKNAARAEINSCVRLKSSEIGNKNVRTKPARV